MRLGGSAQFKTLEKYRGGAPKTGIPRPGDVESYYYLRMGQTKLKQTLDEMKKSENGASPRLRKEVRDGEHGLEAWYILTKEGEDDIVKSIKAANNEMLMVLRDMFGALDIVEAKILLADLGEYVKKLDAIIKEPFKDPYSHLPKNAELVMSTGTKEAKNFFERLGARPTQSSRSKGHRKKKGGER